LWPVLVILLVLALIGALPVWPYSARWGYGPIGTIVAILVILLLLRLLGVV